MKRKRVIIPCVIAALLLCAALWYTRPVSLSTFVPSPEFTHVLLIRYDAEGESEYRSLQLKSGSEDDLIEQLAELSFRRSLFNPILSLLPENGYGRPIQPDQQDFLIRMTGDGRAISLQFSSGSWSYAVGDRYLPCTPAKGTDGAQVVELLWEKATPVESSSES